MYRILIVSHVNKPRYVDISRYTIYQYGLAVYRYSDIVLRQYDTRYIDVLLHLYCVCMRIFSTGTHTALSAGYDTVYSCQMGRLQRWCMYLVVFDTVLDNNNNKKWGGDRMGWL